MLAKADVILPPPWKSPRMKRIHATEDLVNEALHHRAELVEGRIQLNSQEQSNKRCAAVCCRPWTRSRTTEAPAWEARKIRAAFARAPDQPFCASATPDPTLNQFPLTPSVGYGSTLNQLVNSTAPDKGIGLQLNIPLRNRAAQAIQVRGEFEFRQAQMALQQTENRVSIEVRQAQFAVEQNQASVASARAAVDYARQSLEAEQKKYQFGTSTTTAVLQTRSALATAESTLMSAMAAYEKARVELDRAVGNLLDHAGISIDDAARGQVTRMPNAPLWLRAKICRQTSPEPETPPQQPQQQ